jgi:hypothetical protein
VLSAVAFHRLLAYVFTVRRSPFLRGGTAALEPASGGSYAGGGSPGSGAGTSSSATLPDADEPAAVALGARRALIPPEEVLMADVRYSAGRTACRASERTMPHIKQRTASEGIVEPQGLPGLFGGDIIPSSLAGGDT